MSFEILFLILITTHSGTTVIVLAHIGPSAELAVFTLIAIACGLYLFFCGYRLQACKRLLLNAPKPKIQSVSLGLAENPGVVVHPSPGGIEDTLRHALASHGPQRPSPSAPTPEIVRLSEPATSANVGDMTQQSKIAAALSKAGITNPHSWAAAGVPHGDVNVQETLRVSQISVTGKSQTAQPEEQSGFDLRPPVVLMKGEDGPAFLIYWQSQHDLARSLAWKSAVMIWGGAGLMLLGIYALLAQMELL